MKKILSFSFILLLLLASIAFAGEGNSMATSPIIYQEGEILSFGHFEQDGNLDNGKEPIQWIVLDKRNDGSYVLVTRYALAYKPYTVDQVDVTWETCTLRAWLNEEFYNEAFSDEEKARITKTQVSNEANPHYGTNGGNATWDNVYILSIDEAKEYFPNEKMRKCSATRYVVNQVPDIYDRYLDACWWWLRSSGEISTKAASVNNEGFVSDSGFNVHNAFCIRPVIVYMPNGVNSSEIGIAAKTSDSSASNGKIWVDATDHDITKSWQEEQLRTIPTVLFGSYEQDGDLTNGPEPIEWYVVGYSGTEVELFSKYVLDWQYYDRNTTEISWYQSQLYQWLNKTFYEQAFNEAEQSMILPRVYVSIQGSLSDRGVYCSDEKSRSIWSSQSYNEPSSVTTVYDKNEKVYLTPIFYAYNSGDSGSERIAGSVISNYFDHYEIYLRSDMYSNALKQVQLGFPTKYCIAQGAYVWPQTGACNWWTRQGNYFAGDNNVELVKNETVSRRGIRPFITLDRYAAQSLVGTNIEREYVFKSIDDGAQNIHKGDIVSFGHYEQDSITENGEEPIRWLVLDSDQESALLIGLNILDVKPVDYFENDSDYANSIYRRWLNDSFCNSAFSAEEQSQMFAVRNKNIRLVADYYSDNCARVSMEDTEDRVYLLSIDEVDRYFENVEARMSVPTPYAISRGVRQSYHTTINGEATGAWLLRSTGGSFYIDFDSVSSNGYTTYSYYTDGIRPVIRIQFP